MTRRRRPSRWLTLCRTQACLDVEAEVYSLGREQGRREAVDGFASGMRIGLSLAVKVMSGEITGAQLRAFLDDNPS